MIIHRPGTWWELDHPEAPPDELPTPECFTHFEWAQWIAAERAAVNARDFARTARRDMCADCQWSYQKQQMKEGHCNPAYEAITPFHRMLGAVDEDQ